MPEVVGSEPSVVYLIRLMPEPLPSSALSVTLTGAVLFQPVPFAVGERDAAVLGAVVSITTPVLAAGA